MSLRDRLRRREPPDASEPGTAEPQPETGPQPGPEPTIAAGPRTFARSDVTDFDPRSDGDYHCAERGLYLRFARPAVMETDGDDGAGRGPARGEFTSSGRFMVQRRFDRPVIYTVLQVRRGSLTVRRTDAADASTAELVFDFEPDEP